MTSKDVDKLIRAHVWPFVRKQGFVVRGRSARRYWDEAVDVINFQSFNSHQATVHGMTTFSFQLNLGVWPTFLPDAETMSRDDHGRPLVAEYECILRHYVTPTVDNPPRKRSWNPFAFRPLPVPTAVWSVAEDGANAAECVIDSRQGIEVQALPWFDQRRTAEQMLAVMRDDGYGTPMQSYVRGFAAAHAGQTDLAYKSLREALDSGAFDDEAQLLQKALERLAAQSPPRR
jgi:Domain of unknown function (DUF4304)